MTHKTSPTAPFPAPPIPASALTAVAPATAAAATSLLPLRVPEYDENDSACEKVVVGGDQHSALSTEIEFLFTKAIETDADTRRLFREYLAKHPQLTDAVGDLLRQIWEHTNDDNIDFATGLYRARNLVEQMFSRANDKSQSDRLEDAVHALGSRLREYIRLDESNAQLRQRVAENVRLVKQLQSEIFPSANGGAGSGGCPTDLDGNSVNSEFSGTTNGIVPAVPAAVPAANHSTPPPQPSTATSAKKKQ